MFDLIVLTRWLNPADPGHIKRRDALIFFSLVAFYLTAPHRGFDALIPDQIAQAAYWNILLQPNFAGSVGSSSPKGGLMVILGLAHFVSYELIGSSWPFRTMLALLFALLICLVGRIAEAAGGALAGLLAIFVATGSSYLPEVFFGGTSNLFFLPPVLLAMILLSGGRDRAAIVWLCLAATIRPEALLIVGLIIVLRHLRKGHWLRTLEFGCYGGVALGFFVVTAYLSQGDWQRIGGGAANGYPAFPSFLVFSHLRAVLGQFVSERFVALLLLPAAFTMLCVPASRAYLYFFGMIVVYVMMAATGFMGMHYRYIAPGQVIVFALGCAGLVLAFKQLRDGGGPPMRAGLFIIIGGALTAFAAWATKDPVTILAVLALPALYLLAALVSRYLSSSWALSATHGAVIAISAAVCLSSAVQSRARYSAAVDRTQEAILDARELLANPAVPAGSSIVAEDEMLNYVLVKNPGRYSALKSIQSINVMDSDRRRLYLSKADFLVLSQRRNSGWNYLYYYPDLTWLKDSLRAEIFKMITSDKPGAAYGLSLTPIQNTETQFVAQIRAKARTD